ncbi:MAG: histidinol-phosphate transaminase [Methylococcaceae bacterium]|nr:histidinol-phosphate transaminase [Methylococcaceae bacterium]
MNTTDSVSSLALDCVRQLVPYVPGKPIEELERELGISNIIKLASNENPLGPGKKALAAIQSALPLLTLYPDGNGFNLKSALAKKYSLHTDQITLGNGSNELLELVARAFLAPGLEAIFSEHAFAVYPIVTQAVGATPIVVPALNYGNDLEAMAAWITAKTRVVFIANPNNPTGTLLRQTDLDKFIAGLPSHCLCLLDEAYFEFVGSQAEINSLDWLKIHPNLIITRTFSKAYGLAGLRMGYSLSSPEIADILNRVRQPFNNNSLALAAAEAALSDDEYLQQTIAVNNQGMSDLTAGFESLGLEWIPSAGNFIAVDLKRPGQPVYEALLRLGVIVRPIANYGMPNHLRISIGTQAENQFFLKALEKTLANV